MSRIVSITTTVDVDMTDFDDEDLIEELEARGYRCAKGGAPAPNAEDAYLAARPMLGTLPDATREFILDAANRIA